MAKRASYMAYCETCRRNFYTYVLGHGQVKLTRKQAEDRVSDHTKLWPEHVVTVKEKA